MALPLSNTFETGLADETTITVANSDDGSAGNAFDLVQIGGVGVGVYDAARAAHGTLSARITLDGTNGGFLEWDASMGTQTEIFGRVYIYRTATPADDQWLITCRDGSTTAALFRWSTTGKIDVFDSPLSSPATSTNNVPLNQWVRIEWRLLCNATTGIAEAKMFNLDDSSPIETITKSSANTLTQVTQVHIGQFAALASGSDFWLDDMLINNTGYPGPAGTPPVAPVLRVISSPMRW